MLLQSLRALCFAPGGPGSIWKYLEALVRSAGVSGRFVCGFQTDLHFADGLNNKQGGGVEIYRGVYRHHLIMQNTDSLFFPARSPMHSCRAFIDPCNLCDSSLPGTPSYPLTLSFYASQARTSLSHKFPLDANRAPPFDHTVIV